MPRSRRSRSRRRSSRRGRKTKKSQRRLAGGVLGRRRPLEEGDEQQGSPQRRQRIEPIDPFDQTFTNKAELQIALAEADEFYRHKSLPARWAPAALHRWNQSKIMSGKPFAPLNVSHIIQAWDTSRVEDFSNLFSGVSTNGSEFFEGITNWNTANVKNLDGCFARCENFNAPLFWDTSNVTSMNFCFWHCLTFNQPLNWNLSNVTSMQSCFNSCRSFNQALHWNMLSMTSMSDCFYYCPEFNNGGEPIVLDLPEVTSLKGMFSGCRQLNVPITLRNLNKIKDVALLLRGCAQFGSELRLEASSTPYIIIVYAMLQGTEVDNNEEAKKHLKADCERDGISFIPDAYSANGSELVRFLNVYNRGWTRRRDA